jgi:phage-related protein (TIGR01555 family)
MRRKRPTPQASAKALPQQEIPSRIPRPEAELDLEELRRVVLAIGQDVRAQERSELNPFDPSKLTPPPGFGKAAPMAMDEVAGVSQWAVEGIASFLGPREGFIGYPELSLLAQIPEYRSPVEIIATEATREWIKFTSAGDADKSKKIAQIESEFKRLEVQARFHQVSRYDGFYGRGHIYPDVGADLKNLAELLKPIGVAGDKMSQVKIGKGALKELRVIEPVWCWPGVYNSTNPIDPTWYRPETWNVMSTAVHKTRLLTFISREVPDLLKPAYMFGGQSLTQQMRPVVENWLSTRAAVGEIVKRFTHNVIKINVTEAVNSGNAAKMFMRAKLFNEMKGNFGTMILDINEDFVNVSIPLSGLELLQAQAQEHQCSLSRIPQIKLLGIQPAGLNATSEGELRAFGDMIRSYQESFFRPNLETVLRLVQLSLFGEVDDDIGFEFQPIITLTELETAELQKIHADTAAVHLANQTISREEERGRVANDPETPYAGLDAKTVPELSADEAAPLVQSIMSNIVGAFEAALIDKATGLTMLKAFTDEIGMAAIGDAITPAMITEAENEPPTPSPDELKAQAMMVKAQGESEKPAPGEGGEAKPPNAKEAA